MFDETMIKADPPFAVYPSRTKADAFPLSANPRASNHNSPVIEKQSCNSSNPKSSLESPA